MLFSKFAAKLQKIFDISPLFPTKNFSVSFSVCFEYSFQHFNMQIISLICTLSYMVGKSGLKVSLFSSINCSVASTKPEVIRFGLGSRRRRNSEGTPKGCRRDTEWILQDTYSVSALRRPHSNPRCVRRYLPNICPFNNRNLPLSRTSRARIFIRCRGAFC